VPWGNAIPLYKYEANYFCLNIIYIDVSKTKCDQFVSELLKCIYTNIKESLG